MKNRKKIILPNKPVFKRSDQNISRNRPEKAPRSRNFASISLQQHLDFFPHPNKYFPKTIPHGGDADAYFKQTLRNYDYFDVPLFRTPSNHHFVKTSKSLEALRKKKSVKSIPTSLKQKKKPNTPLSSSLRHPVSKTQSATPKLEKHVQASPKLKAEVKEVDVDIFYSPKSQSIKSSSHTLRNQSIENLVKDATQENLDYQSKMAEDADEFIDEFEAADETATDTEAEDETEDEEMKEVEGMIKQAGEDFAEAAEQHQQFLEDEEEDGGITLPQTTKASGDGSIFKFDPTIDAAVLRELEEAEAQAKETAKIIYELKMRVTELLKKEKHTEAEAKELEEKNKQLKAQMIMFEEKTKRIQFLIAQTNLFDKMISPEPPLQPKRPEDVLPKVIVCGMTEHNIPKLILCDDKKRRGLSASCPDPCPKDVNIPMAVVPKFAKRLSDSYSMQEKLAAENADLEGMRYKLQSDLLNKDQTIEYLQRKLCSIQCEMRMLVKENSVLNDKVAQICSGKQQEKQRRAPCGKGKGPCPADIENRLTEYSETTKLLEKQLCDMEDDVKAMQSELVAVQAEREHLEQHKKVIICPPVCAPPPCGPSPCVMPCVPPCSPVFCADQQLRELKEQYCRLQDDFKSKVTEVAGLRADNEKLKATAQDAEEAKKILEEKIKSLELTLRGTKTGGSGIGLKEQMIELEQQLSVANKRFREAQDELEELRSFIQDQQSQMDDYRNKYLEAQQKVEEQKRQIDMLEMDANRVSEQVSLEIQRVKGQFQEKLQELLPLPDLLKATQIKLQETQQMHLLAERNNDALNRDLQIYKDKIEEVTKKLDDVLNNKMVGDDEKANLAVKLSQMEEQIKELEEEKIALKLELEKCEEKLAETDRELKAKMHEIAQLSAQLESVREESARQVARNKERCETVRKCMQNQISDLERQLAQSRAIACSAQRDRDEIRLKMQAQINNLHENFEDAQMRIRNLQGHVNYLKDSHNMSLLAGLCEGTGAGTDSPVSDQQDPCHCGI